MTLRWTFALVSGDESKYNAIEHNLEHESDTISFYWALPC